MTNRVGPKMQAVVWYVEKHPGCSKLEVALGAVQNVRGSGRMSDEAFERRARDLLDSPDAKRADELLMAWQDRSVGNSRMLPATDYAALLGDVIRFAQAVRREALEDAAKVADEQAKEDAAEAETYEDGEDGQDAHLMCAATCRSVANRIRAL